VAESRPIRPGLFDADGPALIAARCAECGKPHFPASGTCPYCAAGGCETIRVGPDGTLRLFTVVASEPPGYRGPLPYGFGVVEVDGGLCLVSRLTETRLERLRPGLPVRLVVEPLYADDAGPVLSYAFAPVA